MHGRLLVAHQDVLEARLLVYFVVDIEYGSAGVTEQVLDTLVRKQRTTISAPVNSKSAMNNREFLYA
jgi:hypothetical protein